MSTPHVHILQELRFQCLACGGCCNSVKVELEDDEPERMAAFAAELGVRDPVVDGLLRLEGGRCVFLGEDNRCRIHARYGATAKPLVCRQFPFVLIETELGMRAGVDPTSFHTLSTWHTAPPFDDAVGKPRRTHLDLANARSEQAILGWCSQPGARVADVLGQLCGMPESAPDLPPGFASRLVTRLHAMQLPLLLQANDAGPAQVSALQPLVDLLPELDPDDPPGWPVLADNEDAFSVEVCRRMVFLRLATRIPIVQGVALLVLSGAVALAWACPEPERFGPAMASWNRLIRGGTFWQSFTPNPADMQWLARGDG